MGSAYSVLGTSLIQLGRGEEGVTSDLEGAERCRGHDDAGIRLHVSTLYAGAAMNIAMDGDGARALPFAEEALVVARDMRSPTAIALAQSAIGRALLADDPAAATVALEESVRLGEAGSMDAIVVPALMFLTTARFRLGDFEAAADPLVRALRRARDSGLDLMVILLVEAAMELLVATERHDVAAVLVGALCEGSLGPLANLLVSGFETFQPAVDRIHAELPAAERATAEAHGAALDARAVVAYALGALERT
jgi:hypothetical protein